MSHPYGSRSKYLPGLSYGQMGGPWSLSWQAGIPNRSLEEKEGVYVYRLETNTALRGRIYLRFAFWACSLRDSQRHMEGVRERLGYSQELGYSWSYFESHEPMSYEDYHRSTPAEASKIGENPNRFDELWEEVWDDE